MKKALLLSLGIAFFVGCSPDSEIISKNESVDLTKIINPDTAKAALEFDTTSNGIYKGVFVSDDMAYHGVLTVNLGNDARYNAILEYGDDQRQRIGFVRINNGASSVTRNIEFRGANTGFILNVSDYTQPVVTDGYIAGQGAQIKVLKETSMNQVRAILGSFTDDLDPAFTGAWDLLSTSTTVINVPTGQPFPSTIPVTVNVISEIVLTKNAIMFNDNVMESFTPGVPCATINPVFPTGPQFPFYSGAQNIFGTDIDEYLAGTQNSTFLGEVATWNLVYSKAGGNKYYDINCTETPAGGTWSWKGRTGQILLN